MSNKEVETQCPKCGEKFLTEFEFEEPEAKVIVKEVDEAKLEEVEQLKGKIAELEQEKLELRQETAERFTDAFEKADLIPKQDPYAQRIFDAIEAKGFDIVHHEAEEEPDVVAGKREGYEYLPAFDISIKK